MKKLLTILLAFIMALSLTACGDDYEGKTPDEIYQEMIEESAKNSPFTEVSIDEQVILDQDDVKVTVTGINAKTTVPTLDLLIENNTDKAICVYANDCSINGIMVEGMLGNNITPGNKLNSGLSFSPSELTICGITTIKDIEFTLEVKDIDDDNKKTRTKSDVISLTTSASSFKQEYDDSGYVAYDENDIKVVVKKVSDETSFWGSQVVFYVENNTDNTIVVQIDDEAVNGFMVNSTFYCNVPSGKRAFDNVVFYEHIFEENKITDVEEFQASIEICESETYDTIAKTDIIKVEF